MIFWHSDTWHLGCQMSGCQNVRICLASRKRKVPEIISDILTPWHLTSKKSDVRMSECQNCFGRPQKKKYYTLTARGPKQHLLKTWNSHLKFKLGIRTWNSNLKEFILEIQTWNSNLKFKLGIHTWNGNLKLKLEIRTWNSNLKFKLEIQMFNSNLKFKPGIQTWNSNLSFKLQNHIIPERP